MKILIFEGIATSGKSTIINGLAKSLEEFNVKVFTEDDTHLPIMEKTDEKHIDFFKDLVEKAVSGDYDLVIFDRLYLTQAFRAKVSTSSYHALEEELIPYSPLAISLKVSEASIAERVKKATEHRESKWGEYVKTKGNSIEEIAQYYIEQQRSQLKLLVQSKIPYRVFDTTDHNYEHIVDEITCLVK